MLWITHACTLFFSCGIGKNNWIIIIIMQGEAVLMSDRSGCQVMDTSSQSTPHWFPGPRDLRFLANQNSGGTSEPVCHCPGNHSPLQHQYYRCDRGKAAKISNPRSRERASWKTLRMILSNLFASSRFCCLYYITAWEAL